MRAPVAHVRHLPLQQRGERDSQTQAILTKLKCAAGKCAAGEGPGAWMEDTQLTPRRHHWGWPACTQVQSSLLGQTLEPHPCGWR